MKRNYLKKGKSDDKKNLHQLLLKNNIFSTLNTPHLNTIYINTTRPNNLKIIKKKNINFFNKNNYSNQKNLEKHSIQNKIKLKFGN